MRAKLLVVIALAVAVALTPFASSSPDGLNRVAADHAFAGAAKPEQRAPVPAYAFPGVENGKAAKALAGLAGTLAVFSLAYGGSLVLRRRGRVS